MTHRLETRAYFLSRGYSMTRARFRWPKEYRTTQFRHVIRGHKAELRKGYGPPLASRRMLPKRARLSKGMRRHIRREKAAE